MTNKSDYLIIPRSVFDYKDKNKHLLPEELYVFAWLHRHRIYSSNIDYDMMSCFSVDGLSQRIKFRERQTRNKMRIREILINLYRKGYIDSNDQLDSELPYNHLHDLFFTKYDGYDTHVTYDIFDKFENPSEFYVYACIDRLGETGFNMSYEGWEKVTGHKKDKVISIFDKMNTEKYHTRIWVFSGDYFVEDGLVKQEVNQYYTRPSKRLMKLWNRVYDPISEEEKEGSPF